MSQNNDITIDIQRIIEKKTKLKVPHFLFGILKKVICQDEINKVLLDNKDKTGVDFMVAVLNDFSIKTSISGIDNIPENQKLIFASNHPFGALEALALGKHLGKIFDNNINFITNEMLSLLKPLSPIFTSVKVGESHQNKSSIITLDEIFASDKQIIMFPSGVVSRKINGKLQDGEWKKMFVSKARLYRRNIVPVFCSGSNSDFFLNLSNFRKFLGIKANIELILLPREMFKNKNTSINITIGKPISYKTFSTEKTDLQWANLVKEKVYELQN
jgi:1-acyl-sn-glycerol-3-phosphate acyltransferase